MNLQPIWPPVPFCRMPKACDSCGKDVCSDAGFADLDAKPGTYFCVTCTSICIGARRTSDALDSNQRRYFNMTGHWPVAH